MTVTLLLTSAYFALAFVSCNQNLLFALGLCKTHCSISGAKRQPREGKEQEWWVSVLPRLLNGCVIHTQQLTVYSLNLSFLLVKLLCHNN